jgi:hypothetical protein
MKFSPYITELLREKSGHEIRLSRDCELLALDVESVTGEHIGVNTMKRLLGFIADERTPRTSTLDVVARYLGYANWDELRLIDENSSNSAFDDRDEYLTCYLEKGQQVIISYPPNRTLTIENLGDNHFRVVESENSKLLKGDVLTLTHIVRHYPLLVAEVVRDGHSLGAFTAGKAQGIDFELL